MKRPRALTAALFAIAACGCASAPGTAGDPAPVAAAGPLAFLHGEWQGQASVAGSDGEWIQLTQTERVGPMLDGALTVIEGRAYDADGKVQFNAFAIAAPNGQTGKWEMRSYTGSSAGTFPFEPKQDGYVWSTPAGPDAITRYTATITGDRWDQIGEYVPKAGEPRKVFEMHLTRTGGTTWPAAGAVVPE